MYRVCKIADIYYAASIWSLEDDEDINDIQSLVEEGTPVIIVQELEDLADLGIKVSEIRTS